MASLNSEVKIWHSLASCAKMKRAMDTAVPQEPFHVNMLLKASDLQGPGHFMAMLLLQPHSAISIAALPWHLSTLLDAPVLKPWKPIWTSTSFGLWISVFLESFQPVPNISFPKNGLQGIDPPILGSPAIWSQSKSPFQLPLISVLQPLLHHLLLSSFWFWGFRLATMTPKLEKMKTDEWPIACRKSRGPFPFSPCNGCEFVFRVRD